MNMTEQNLRLVFGLKVRQLRESQKLALKDIAERSGLSISYVNEIERGKKYPKAEKIAALARALGTTYDDLVSVQLSPELLPLSNVFKANIFDSLPLQLFGIDRHHFTDLMVQSPAKFNAFVMTLIELARSHDLGVENFFFAALRSYQEMHDNYFADIEQEAERYAKESGFEAGSPEATATLEHLLLRLHSIAIRDLDVGAEPTLAPLRSVWIPGAAPRLMLNPRMNSAQRAFVLAREIGYHAMGLVERASTSSWITVDSFEQLLNNFRMSYFAGALLLPAKPFAADIKALFAMPEWRPDAFRNTMKKWHVTSETLLHRMTQLLPPFFDLRKLYFLRFSTGHSNEFELTKELHLAELHSPHGTQLDEHYCRRWVTLTALHSIHTRPELATPLFDVQRSRFFTSGSQYLNITAARRMTILDNHSTSITLGLPLDDTTRKKVRFAMDAAIRDRVVDQTCQRCPLSDCTDRVAPPVIVQRKRALEARVTALRDYLSRREE